MRETDLKNSALVRDLMADGVSRSSREIYKALNDEIDNVQLVSAAVHYLRINNFLKADLDNPDDTRTRYRLAEEAAYTPPAPSKRDKIRQLMSDGIPRSSKEIAEAMPDPTTTDGVRRVVHEMKKNGELVIGESTGENQQAVRYVATGQAPRSIKPKPEATPRPKPHAPAPKPSSASPNDPVETALRGALTAYVRRLSDPVLTGLIDSYIAYTGRTPTTSPSGAQPL